MNDQDYKTLNENSFIKNTLLLYLISPITGLLIALRYYRNDWSKNILWLFCIFFGYTFIIGTAGEGSADSYRYTEEFLKYAHSNMNLIDLMRSLYSEGSENADIAQPLITFLVSRITDNPAMLFATFGFIFGYFYSRNIWYVLDRIEGSLTVFIFIYIVTFALINPIWNINGVRMYTAAQIFLFGTLPYLLEKKSKRLIWSGLSVFVHFSFVLPVAILLLFIIFKNRLNIYFLFFILTSLIKEIDLQQVQSALSFLPGFLQSRVTSYTDLEYAETVQIRDQAVNWYIPFSYQAIKWVIYAMTTFIYLFGRKILKNKKDLLTLLSFSLLLYGFANISSLVPAGGRFLTVANTFLFPFFILFITNFPKLKGIVICEALSIPLLLLFCLVAIRTGMDYYGLVTVFGNPIFAALNVDSGPFITGIKRLF
jgi:hypothetical protein